MHPPQQITYRRPVKHPGLHQLQRKILQRIRILQPPDSYKLQSLRNLRIINPEPRSHINKYIQPLDGIIKPSSGYHNSYSRITLKIRPVTKKIIRITDNLNPRIPQQ